MRVFAVSDIHLDYKENFEWFNNISYSEYKDDLLILAGDISDKISTIENAFNCLSKKFRLTMYVPGNHDLWVLNQNFKDSIDKFVLVRKLAKEYGVMTEPFHMENLHIIPLYGWYDYSFGSPAPDLFEKWADYFTCKWPFENEAEITEYFLDINEDYFNYNKKGTVITFSHFVPRIDVMPSFIPLEKREIYPVLGSHRIEDHIRRIGSNIHIYGHSHVNRKVQIDDILYINNAFGYPYETRITAKKLIEVYE
ncbi:MAG TPA: metallophosphoesterase, partial [Clostridia bacterium]